MFTRKVPPEAPHLLEVTDAELDMIHDALIIFMINSGRFARPEPRRLLSEIDKARARAKARLAAEPQNHDLVYKASRTYPLLDWIEACHEATADPVKGASALRAKARPSRVTGSAPHGNRAAKRTKTKSEQEGRTCPES